MKTMSESRKQAMVLLARLFGLPLPRQLTPEIVADFAELVRVFNDDVIVLPSIEAEYTRRVREIYIRAFGSREQAEAHALPNLRE